MLCLPLLLPRTPSSPLFPYTTLFRSMFGCCPFRRIEQAVYRLSRKGAGPGAAPPRPRIPRHFAGSRQIARAARRRSEEHTSELQSPCNLVCRLLLEKKKIERRDRDNK